MSRSRDIANLLGTGSELSNKIDKSVVDAKGDILIGSGDNTVTRLAAGSTGQMPITDSSTSSGLRYVDPPVNRNLIINGAMQVAQYGSATSTAGGYYAADRFRYTRTTNTPSVTHTVENDGPSNTGLTKSRKILWGSAVTISAGSSAFLIQHIEGQNLQNIKKGTASAQKLTLSFWVKASVTGTYIAQLSSSGRFICKSYTISSAETWEYKTLTFDEDTTGTISNDSNAGMSLTMWLFAGSDYAGGTLQTTWAVGANNSQAVGQVNAAASANNYWQITGVQLEIGSIPTPFEFEPYETTLRKCQRYYFRVGHTGGGPAESIGSGFYYNASNIIGHVYFPVTMRAKPTLESSNSTNGFRFFANNTSDDFNSLTISNASLYSSGVSNSTESSGTAGQAGQMTMSSATAFVAFSAEL